MEVYSVDFSSGSCDISLREDNSLQLCRPLHFYEALLVGAGVGIVLLLEGNVTSELVIGAWKLTRREHPFLRMKLLPALDDEKQLSFWEDVSESNPVFLEFEVGEVTDDSWMARLDDITHGDRDHSKAVVYLKLVSNETCDRHEIHAIFNHSGMDAPGLFEVFHSFLSYLGRLGEAKPTEVEPREFVDILSRIPRHIMELALTEVPESYLPKADGNIAAKGDPKISALYSELTEQETKTLRSSCRNHNSTIQGVVSAASFLALAKAQEDRFPLPQTIVAQCPANQRKEVSPPVGKEDCVCGSAALVWLQVLDPLQSLWNVVEQATSNIRKQRDSQAGLRWWGRMTPQKAETLPQYSVMASSIGVNPIQDQYDQIKVLGVKIKGSAYRGFSGSVGTMTHIHTVCGRMNTTFQYTSPSYSDEWARSYDQVQRTFIDKLVHDEHCDTKLVQQFLEELGQIFK